MFKNKKSKIIYRDGMPYSRFVNYAELVILEKKEKLQGNPILKDSEEISVIPY